VHRVPSLSSANYATHSIGPLAVDLPEKDSLRKPLLTIFSFFLSATQPRQFYGLEPEVHIIEKRFQEIMSAQLPCLWQFDFCFVDKKKKKGFCRGVQFLVIPEV
jgi:hypothetical protein